MWRLILSLPGCFIVWPKACSHRVASQPSHGVTKLVDIQGAFLFSQSLISFTFCEISLQLSFCVTSVVMGCGTLLINDTEKRVI